MSASIEQFTSFGTIDIEYRSAETCSFCQGLTQRTPDRQNYVRNYYLVECLKAKILIS